MGFNQFISNGGGLLLLLIGVVGTGGFIAYGASRQPKLNKTGGTRRKRNKINKSRRNLS